MWSKFKTLATAEEGQGFSEYGLLLGIVALGIVAGLVAFRTQLATLFSSLTTALGNASSAPAN